MYVLPGCNNQYLENYLRRVSNIKYVPQNYFCSPIMYQVMIQCNSSFLHRVFESFDNTHIFLSQWSVLLLNKVRMCVKLNLLQKTVHWTNGLLVGKMAKL